MPNPVDEAVQSTTDAIREVAGEANRLAQTAADELEHTARLSIPAAILISGGGVLALAGVTTTAVALGLLLSGRRAGGVFFVGGSMVLAGAVLGASGTGKLPKNPFRRTREELRQNLAATAEQLR